MKKQILFLVLTFCSTISFSQLNVLSDGKVGIGTSSPNNSLQVAGLIKFDDTYYNTFLGTSSGASNTTGAGNTFTGYQSGYSNTTGTYNTFSGRNAGGLNVSGQHNSFLGYYAGSKTTASYNTAVGSWAGNNNTSGDYNTYVGQQSGYYTNTGYRNTFIGFHAGYNNTTGYYNTFLGYGVGGSNTTGSYNTILGYAGGNNTTGSYNTLLGYNANVGGSAYSNATAIGYNTTVSANNCVCIGNTSVSWIGGQVTWSTYSDGRFKTNVSENVKGLEFINKLRPVTYQINTQACDAFVRQNMPLATDSSGTGISEIPIDYSASMSIVHSGFIAQEVDSVAQLCGFSSSIVHTPANSADPYSLSYAEFVVPLVKAVQELNTIITEQDQQIQALVTQIEEQREQINTIETDLAHCCAATPTDKMISPNNKANIQSAEAKLYQNIPQPIQQKDRYPLFRS